LPDTKANHVHEKVLIGNHGRGVGKKSGLHNWLALWLTPFPYQQPSGFEVERRSGR
jgi:hypothetical protein